MKKIYILLLVFSIGIVANSQNENQSKIREIGDFVLINQICNTSVYNRASKSTIVQKVILKKSMVTSIVLLLEIEDNKSWKDNISKVVVTTNEKIIYSSDGVSSKAMGSSYKFYEFIFEESANVESFAIELSRLCSSN